MSDRHLRQGFLGKDSQQAITNARVAIIGLCGGGSPTAQLLAHIGVGTFDIFDHDNADGGNTNRMMGLTAEDAEKEAPKVDVIERLIKGINPSATVNKYGRWEDNHLILRSETAIFGCVDSYLGRYELERYARRFLVPYIDLGMDVYGTEGRYSISGQVILSLPGHFCMRCMGIITDERLSQEAKRYGAAGGNPQVAWPNGTLASVAVGKFMAMLTAWNTEMEPSLYSEYDGNRFTVFDSHRLAALKGRVCRHHDGENGVGDIIL
jgi:molybdopterin-synthase adenylyltransferase